MLWSIWRYGDQWILKLIIQFHKSQFPVPVDLPSREQQKLRGICALECGLPESVSRRVRGSEQLSMLNKLHVWKRFLFSDILTTAGPLSTFPIVPIVCECSYKVSQYLFHFFGPTTISSHEGLLAFLLPLNSNRQLLDFHPWAYLFVRVFTT